MSRSKPIRLTLPQPMGLWDHLEAFYTAVDFQEPAVLGILLGNLGLLLLAVKVRNSAWGHIALFAYLLGACFLLSTVNEYLQTHWQGYFSQNYFDDSGLFLCLLVGCPYLLICLFLLVKDMQSCSLLRNYHSLRGLSKSKTS